jgi:hypothetical protein
MNQGQLLCCVKKIHDSRGALSTQRSSQQPQPQPKTGFLRAAKSKQSPHTHTESDTGDTGRAQASRFVKIIQASNAPFGRGGTSAG